MTLSAPPLVVPKDPPSPGPGQYNLWMYDSVSKHSMIPSAAFASKTERTSQNQQAEETPGPGEQRGNTVTDCTGLHDRAFNHTGGLSSFKGAGVVEGFSCSAPCTVERIDRHKRQTQRPLQEVQEVLFYDFISLFYVVF